MLSRHNLLEGQILHNLASITTTENHIELPMQFGEKIKWRRYNTYIGKVFKIEKVLEVHIFLF